jgi:hypothetical protein
MKKVLVVLFILALACTAMAQKGKKGCDTIKDGVVMYSAGHYLAGQPLTTGYDPFGYNYQAHMFNGSYFNAYAGGAGFPPYEGDDAEYLAANPGAANHWAWPYRNDDVSMKWNDAWLSNMDCDNTVGLDRHFGFPSYIGSGAWETNHQSGTYVDETTGKECHWTYFIKIIAVPADATRVGDPNVGIWYAADGTEIGPDIWGEFAIIQEVYTDTGTGDHGISYRSPAAPGFGKYK